MATDPTRPVESEPDYSEPIHMGTFRAVTSPSDYHQKLAEAIDLKLEQESGYGKSVSIIAAVLADEQVVAPATLQWWKDTCDYWDKQAEERDNRIAVQVASSKDLEQQLADLRAKVAEAENMLALAVKGRLMTSVSLHPVEIALAALRTGDSDE